MALVVVTAMPKGKRVLMLFLLPMVKSATVIQPVLRKVSALRKAKSET